MYNMLMQGNLIQLSQNRYCMIKVTTKYYVISATF